MSHVTDMSHMFERSNFNGDISKWNVSNVKDMTGMFKQSSFDGDISGWNVSNVRKHDDCFDDSRLKSQLHKQPKFIS